MSVNCTNMFTTLSNLIANERTNAQIKMYKVMFFDIQMVKITRGIAILCCALAKRQPNRHMLFKKGSS